MRALLVVLALIPAVLILNPAVASDDKALQEQRREAQKQRQTEKNDRNKQIREATKTYREYSRDLKKDYQEQLRDLDTQFRLQQVDLRTERSAQISAAEADMQQKVMQLMTNPESQNTEAAMTKLRDEMKSHADRVFEIKRQAAQQEQTEIIANERSKHQLMTELDQLLLDEAKSLGLTEKYPPILATAIGDKLTTQEERWNEREMKDVERLFQTNQRLFREIRYRTPLHEWEIANKQEDFELEWQKRAELHALNSENSFYNLMFTQTASGGEIDQQELTRRATELSQRIQEVNRKHQNTLAKNRILRAEEKRKIMDQ